MIAMTDRGGELFRPATLLFLRVTTGFLLVWWGLNKAMTPQSGVGISNTFYQGLFSAALVQQLFGVCQVVLAALVILGLLRRFTLPLQAIINAGTAAAVWYAIIDPFNWWLGNERPIPVSQLFYPSIIIFAASLLLIAFRRDDRFALDNALRR